MSVLTQTFALFVDAYRELNAKRLFWITLVISLTLVLVLATIGISPHGLKFFAWEWPDPAPVLVYKSFLLKFCIVDFWLTTAASVLALISTAGIFPDFLSGGAVDLYLCKPMSRPRLFLTKYVAGLMFVALQVAAVTAGVFFVVRLRLGEWRPSLLLAIPVVVCFFSYLYSVCVLLGVMTRSTVAAILLTVLAWVTIISVQSTEWYSLQFQYANEGRVVRYEARAKREEAQLQKLREGSFTTNPFGIRSGSSASDLDKWHKLRDDAKKAADVCAGWHRIFFAALTVLPKNTATINLLDKYLFTKEELGMPDVDDGYDTVSQSSSSEADKSVVVDASAQMFGMYKANRVSRSRSLLWILGTSLAFEAVVVAWAAWIFCRRDY